MNDDELGRRFDALNDRLSALVGQINTKLDDILDKLSAVRADTDNTKGHLIYVMNDSLTLSQRITKLEDELRGRSAP